MKEEYEPILKFWFGDDLTQLKSKDYVPNYKLWFTSTKETDDLIRNKFEVTFKKAANGDFDYWKTDIHGSLSLIILFDQFSRNIYRGTANMFAFDPKALEIAKNIVTKDAFHKELSQVEQAFVYLVFEHSENINDLQFVIDTLKPLSSESKIFSAFYNSGLEHYEVLKKFGRYSHRNEILGRKSTPEEVEHLKNSDLAKQVEKK